MNYNDEKDSLPVWIKPETVTAYTESISTSSLAAYPSSVHECQELISFAKSNGLTICPRGNGNSFADMILNDGHVVLKSCRMNKVLQWDQGSGQMVVEPGVTMAQIFTKALPFNWVIPACPGNPEVTVGGAISNNVHGKDSWCNGNFGSQVISLKLLTSSEKIILIHHETDRQLFEAVVSGMGLLGIIVEVTLQLKKILSPFIEEQIIPTKNLEDLHEKLEHSKKDYDFSIGWVDAFAKKSSLGRGFLSVSRWIDHKINLSSDQIYKAVTIPKKIYGVLPLAPTWFLLRPVFSKRFMRIANVSQYSIFQAMTSLRGVKVKRKFFPDYLFMFNKLPEYPRVFRPYGYASIQPLIPVKDGIDGVKEAFRICQKFGYEPLMVGVKSTQADNYMLSFSGEGYSFACDVHLGRCNLQHLKEFARVFIQHTLDCGGRIFLAKDQLLPKDLFQRMYPRFNEFLEVKNRLDPDTLFASDMYRRLLCP
jgi:FAD/FMN-containing dehydrogenase